MQAKEIFDLLDLPTVQYVRDTQTNKRYSLGGIRYVKVRKSLGAYIWEEYIDLSDAEGQYAMKPNQFGEYEHE